MQKKNTIKNKKNIAIKKGMRVFNDKKKTTIITTVTISIDV